ncbi:helix-turn-helix domain-containing protein [Planococcus sp. SIMBA_160]
MKSEKIKAVVVDDENRIRRGIERLVLSCGEEWEVTASFGDGQELLDAYEETPFDFDVLITDIRMPITDGLTLIKEMKKFTSFNPVVISGFDDFHYLQTALREGALDYLLKPVDREEFKKQMEKLKQEVLSQRRLQEKEIVVQHQVSKLEYIKQVEKLSQVTKGFEPDVSLLDWTEEFPECLYSLMYVTIDQPMSHSRTMKKDEWNTWVLANENIINEMLSDSSRDFWKWRGEDASFWILLCSKTEEEEIAFKEELNSFSMSMQKNVQKTIPFSNSVAISKPFEDLTFLQTITKDVLALMQYRPVFGNSQIFQQDLYVKTSYESELKNAGELQQAIQRVIQAMERMNEQELKHHIHLFADKLQTLRLSSEVEFFLQSLSIQLINYIIKFKPRLNNDLLDIQGTVSLLQKSGNIDELRKELEDWLIEVYEKLMHVNKENVHDQVREAKSWITLNLKESITIEKIAGHVYMNPTYFCEYFKNETGETVLDYVTRSRINKARELLLTTNLKIYEIAEQVGYTDTKYFSKLFKKHYGELPSKYKEKIKS